MVYDHSRRVYRRGRAMTRNSIAVAGPELAKRGKVERRRREYRHAEGAKGVRYREGVSPSHWVWEGGYRLQKNLFDFESQIVEF